MDLISYLKNLPSESVGHLVMVLFFLAALAAVAGFKIRLFGLDRKSYHLIGSGLFLFALASLHQLYASLGLLRFEPTIGGIQSTGLIYWLVSLAGIVLVLRGAADRLKYRTAKETGVSSSHEDQVSLSLGIVRAFSEQQPPVEVITKLLHWLQGSTRTEAVAEFYRFSGGELRLFATAGPTENKPGQHQTKFYQVNDRVNNQLLERRTCSPDELAPEKLIAGVKQGGRLLGCYMIQTTRKRIVSGRLRRHLETAASLTGQLIIGRASQLKAAFEADCNRVRSGIFEALFQPGTIPVRLGEIIKQLSALVTANYVALSVIEQDTGEVTRYSRGPSDRFLKQGGLSLPSPDSILGPAFHSAETLVFGNLVPGHQPDPRVFITCAEIKSVAAVPYRINTTRSAVLMLGATRPNAFPVHLLDFLTGLAPLIARLLDEGKEHPLQLGGEPGDIRRRIIPLGASEQSGYFEWPEDLNVPVSIPKSDRLNREPSLL